MQSQREISTFPLPPTYQSKLHLAGYLVAGDLKDIKPSELSKDLEVSHEEALLILNCFNGLPSEGNSSNAIQSGRTLTALELLQEEQSMQSIVTFSEKLDSMLGGGIPLCKITEFCGAPGIGKTQMCMQLAVDVQIPERFGGVEGEAVYIDTEGSFLAERLADIAEVTVKHCQQLDTTGEVSSVFTTERVLSGVHYFRCRDYVELLATIHLLTDFIKDYPKVKLVIIDSIAFHFRHDFEDLSLRTRLLTTVAQNLIQIANQHKLAVVLTNQMTTRVSNQGDMASSLIPALGESWAHVSTIRIILYWEDKQRMALLYKSPDHKEETVPFQITMGGIRDMISSNVEVEKMSEETEENIAGPAAKRQKVT